MTKKDLPMEKIIPQRVNANKHTPRGMKLLEQSIGERGWIGAITVAADGQVFDGSARRETIETAGLDEPIIVRTNGRQPVVVVREDIPNADDPRARQLAIEANRIAELNLAWDGEVLAEAVTDEIADEQLFRPEELAAILPADVDAFQPNLAPETSQALVSQEQIDKMKKELEQKFKERAALKPIVCPHCAGEFYLQES